MKSYGIEAASDGTRIDFNDISIESLGAHVLFGDVDEETTKEASIFLLKASQLFRNKELTFFINTCGGHAYDGFALIDLMEICKLPIKTVGLGSVMSMGVYIFAAGTKGRRILTKNTLVMAHQFSGGTHGKYHELIQDHKANEYLRHQTLQHFKRHTTMTEKQIDDILFGASDRYLTPSECKKFGICDQIVDELPDFNVDFSTTARSPVRQPRLAKPRTPAAGSKRQPR